MSFPTKIQCIKREKSQQWYVNFPSAMAQALDFLQGEVMHWTVHDRQTLVLQRPDAPPSPLKKTPRSPTTSSGSSPSRPNRPPKAPIRMN